MACNDQLVIIYSIEVIVPAGIISCPEPLYSCKPSLLLPRCHSRDDQVIIPQKVGGFHDIAAFTLEHMMMKFPIQITLSFPEPSHRCTTLVPCPRCHTDQFQKAGVDHHAGEGALPNAIIPTSRSFPEQTDRRRCNRFPCPRGHPGRSSAPAMSTAEVDHDEIFKHHVISKEFQSPYPKYQQVRGQSHNMVLDSCHASAGVLIFNPIVNPMRTFPDREHRCTEFPCPKCHGGQSQEAVHGVRRISASGSGIPIPAPEEVMINFPEPTGHRCNRFPCPLCHPGRSAATDRQDDNIEIKHVKISKELMQNPRPKYHQMLPPQVVPINPIPMRTFSDPGHRCTELTCPNCHRGPSQSLGVIHTAGDLPIPIGPCKTHDMSAPLMCHVKASPVSEVDQSLIVDFVGHLMHLFASTRQLRQSCRKYQQACNLQPLESALVHVGG